MVILLLLNTQILLIEYRSTLDSIHVHTCTIVSIMFVFVCVCVCLHLFASGGPTESATCHPDRRNPNHRLFYWPIALSASLFGHVVCLSVYVYIIAEIRCLPKLTDVQIFRSE
jgi:hypothetical protein